MGIFGKGSKTSTLAVDIGSNSIKVMQMAEPKVLKENSYPKLQKLGITLTPHQAVKDGFITDVKSVSQTLSKILLANQIKERYCVTAISGQQVIARLVKLPPMSEEEVKQAISYQAERYIPFPIDQVVLDVQVLGEVMEGETKKISVLLVAAQKGAINSLVETLRLAGLTPTVIEVEPFVSLRSSYEFALRENEELLEKNLLVIDIGASSCDISVVSSGILRFARIIPIAGINFTRALSTTLHLNFEDAEKTKKQQGAAVIDSDKKDLSLVVTKQISNVLSPILGSLLNEIQRSLAYYESRFRRSRIEKVLLSGGSSKLRGLNKFFQKELGLEVITVNPLQNLDYDKSFSAEYLSEVSSLTNVVCGLCLREMSQASLEKFTKDITLDNNFEFGSSRQTSGFATAVG